MSTGRDPLWAINPRGSTETWRANFHCRDQIRSKRVKYWQGALPESSTSKDWCMPAERGFVARFLMDRVPSTSVPYSEGKPGTRGSRLWVPESKGASMKASLLWMRDLLHAKHLLLAELAYCHLVSDLTCALPAKAERLKTCFLQDCRTRSS